MVNNRDPMCAEDGFHLDSFTIHEDRLASAGPEARSYVDMASLENGRGLFSPKV